LQEVTDKILFRHKLFSHGRYLAQLNVGTMPHGQIMYFSEFMKTKAAPVVHAEIARKRTYEKPGSEVFTLAHGRGYDVFHNS
jgi:hypothetical protein